MADQETVEASNTEPELAPEPAVADNSGGTTADQPAATAEKQITDTPDLTAEQNAVSEAAADVTADPTAAPTNTLNGLATETNVDPNAATAGATEGVTAEASLNQAEGEHPAAHNEPTEAAPPPPPAEPATNAAGEDQPPMEVHENAQPAEAVEANDATEAAASNTNLVEEVELPAPSQTRATGAEVEPKTEGNEIVPLEIPSATVKIVLLPTGQVATMKCALNQTLKELKEHFAVELKIPSSVILLLLEEVDLSIFENESDDEEVFTSNPLDTVDEERPSAPLPQSLPPSPETIKVERLVGGFDNTPRHKVIAESPFEIGEDMDNGKTLADLGVGPNGTVQLEMQSSDPVNTPIKAFRPPQVYVMPDVITVRVETEPRRYKDIVVEVERATLKKPFLGGYRHKQTHKEFHHASAQTGLKQRPISNIERYCRDTQTYYMKHRRQQTNEDTSTQMTKIGVYVSNIEDKLITPGKYTTAEQHHRMVLRKVVILQKYWRRWLAKRYVDKIKDDRLKRLEWEEQKNAKKKDEKQLRIKKEFERRMNPKTKEDFDLLYAALEKWRLEELDKINQTVTGAERKAALCQLLEQETQLIGSIGRHKMDADIENKQNVIQNFLDKAAAPKKWKGPDGCYTEMDTPYTIRAQELKDIYNSICMKYLTQDERLDVLLTLKHTVKEHDCKLTRDIIELIDREADLLMRGVKDANLEGLRKRISTLFLQYIKTPTFNPEVARLLKVPQDASTLRQNIYFCASCNRYLPSVEFQLSTNSRTVGRCRNCRQIDNDARTRHDYSHYRLMLRDLRRVEESYGDDSKVAFLLQENDLRYLVEKIWNSQSIISAWDDHYDLILVRWNKHKEWSPWNCVLVTREEATAHERLESLDEGYGRELIHKVQKKHALAKNYFSRLPGMSEYMRKKVVEPQNGPAVEGIAVN